MERRSDIIGYLFMALAAVFAAGMVSAHDETPLAESVLAVQVPVQAALEAVPAVTAD